MADYLGASRSPRTAATHDCAATAAKQERKANNDGDPTNSKKRNLPAHDHPDEPVRGLTIGAAIGLLFAVLITGSPFLLALAAESDDNSSGGAAFALMFVTVPMGAIIGVMSVIMLIIVSIMGIGRARGTSVVRLIMAIAAPLLMVVPLVLLIIAAFNGWVSDEGKAISAAVIFGVTGLVGAVLAIITGLTSPPKNIAVGGTAS